MERRLTYCDISFSFALDPCLFTFNVCLVKSGKVDTPHSSLCHMVNVHMYHIIWMWIWIQCYCRTHTLSQSNTIQLYTKSGSPSLWRHSAPGSTILQYVLLIGHITESFISGYKHKDCCLKYLSLAEKWSNPLIVEVPNSSDV